MVSVSMVLRALSWFKSFTSRSRSIFTKAANISAVAPASSTALWWFWSEILRALATVSSLNRLRLGRRSLAMATVSSTVGSKGSSSFSAKWPINPTSKLALWATRTASPTNSRNCGRITSIFGYGSTMESLIPVSFSISKGMGTSGFTKVENLSVILPSTTFTAPISIILFFLGLKPVVSISNTTKVSPKSWPLEFSTSCLVSSTRYPSTP